MKNFLKDIPIFLKNELIKKVSFYLALVATILTLVASLVFASPNLTQSTDLRGYFDGSNNINLIFSIVSIIVLLFLSISRETFLYGKMLSWALVFVNFLIYVKTIYMYFAGVFYNGFSMDAIKAIDPGCIISLVLFVVACILGNVAIYLNNKKKEAKDVVQEN